jgi:hypothetical protein
VSLCALCGISLTGDLALCPHHHGGEDQEHWADGNRIMCDFLHRGLIPPRLTPQDRGDELVAAAIEAA